LVLRRPTTISVGYRGAPCDPNMSNEREYVYALGHPHGFVKIGRSKDPRRRLKDHQISSSYELWVIIQVPVPNAAKTEKEMHERFSDSLVSGEWFNLGYRDYDILIDLLKMAQSERDFKSVRSYRIHKAENILEVAVGQKNEDIEELLEEVKNE